MTGAQNNRNGNFDIKDGNSKGSFEEHNERMKAFRLTHPSNWTQKHNERMKAFRLAHPNNWRQWGHKVAKGQEYPPVLVPTVLLRREALATYSPN